MTRIGIVGVKGAGKSTIAARLIDAHHFKEVAIAAPMKEMLAVGLGIPRELLYGSQAQKEAPWRYGKSPRQLLQSLGTEWGREMVSDRLWLDLALERTIPAYEAEHGPTRWVISDVRFLNEAAVLREHGFTIWRVEREGCIGDGHASEREQTRILADDYLENSDTLDALHARIWLRIQKMES